jgi:hypothetical protein
MDVNAIRDKVAALSLLGHLPLDRLAQKVLAYLALFEKVRHFVRQYLGLCAETKQRYSEE